MIYRIEPGYLRTQDSLSKRERRQPRRRYAPEDVRKEDEHEETPPHLQEENHSTELDLVA